VLHCVECGRESADKAVGWRALLNGEPDEDEYVAIFCPVCAEREFGPSRRHDHQTT
jgi:hypothetical protein